MGRLQDIIRWKVQRPLLPLALGRTLHAPASVVADCVMPDGLLDDESICYCAGVGEDLRFEETIAQRDRARIWTFDPTPRAIRFVQRRDLPPNIEFVPVGLWSEDTKLRFFAPADPNHVSHTIEGPQGGTGHFDAPCRSVSSLMREHGHERLDLLKMNIEGAEDRVLEPMLENGIHPRIITLTYEGSGAFSKAIRWTRRLCGREGYALIGVRGWFVTYLHQAE